ncbi:MAG: WG repeat-containing protein, partial [Bacteroidaceae bacterium]|nr:WG repeat-containing protein [Bacteroidaceae bacterium]
MNQFVFNEIHPFKSDDKKWGYKKDNKIIIEPLYQGAMPFHDDICWVKQIAWGAIDIKKNNIIPFIYKHVNRLCPNRYLVCSFKNRY